MISICICTHGSPAWEEVAWARAYPSTLGQADEEIVSVSVVHLKDGTLADARNQAARDSLGDWLCFLDADDELAPGYINAMLNTARYHDAPLYYGPLLMPAVQYIDRNGVASEPAIPNKGRWPDMNEGVIGTLVQKRLFEDVGGFRDLPSIEDYDLWLRCVKAGARIHHVPDAVYIAHVNPNGGRNSDQSVYQQLRREHAAVWK